MGICNENKITAKRLLRYEAGDRLPERVIELLTRYEYMMTSRAQAVELPNQVMAVLLCGLGEIEPPAAMPEEKLQAEVKPELPYKIVVHGPRWRTVVDSKTGVPVHEKKVDQKKAEEMLAEWLKKAEVRA